MKKNILALLISMILLAGCTAAQQQDETQNNQNIQESDENTIVIELNAFNFGYSEQEIRVKQGDTVKIIMTNTDGTHDLVIDEYNVRTPITSTGETETIEFTADQIGSFEYYCSVGSHREMGMVGTLIVE